MPRRNYRKKSKSAGALALQKVNKLSRAIKPEMKTNYTGTTIANVTNSVITSHLTNINEGTAFDQRVGSQINVKRQRCRVYLKWNLNQTVQQVVRILLVQSNQQFPDLAPTIGTVLPTNLGTWIDYNSMQWKATNGEYVKVLYDKRHVLSSQTPAKFVDIDIRMNTLLRYNGTAAADIQKNGIYFMIVSDYGGANYPSYEAIYLTEYTDM